MFGSALTGGLARCPTGPQAQVDMHHETTRGLPAVAFEGEYFHKGFATDRTAQGQVACAMQGVICMQQKQSLCGSR